MTETLAAAPAVEADPAHSTMPAQAAQRPPSVHLRAFITWLAIFPLVTAGLTVSAPLTEGWHPALKALVLTLFVVPLAVYLVVPRLMAGHGALRRRRTSRRARR